MRKVAFILAIVMLFTTLAIPAMAAEPEPRMTTIIPGISFEGTTATCTARITANSLSEELDATIKLYRGNTLIATWTAEGNGYIFFSKTKTVTKGYTYKLTVALSIDGRALTPVSTTATC